MTRHVLRHALRGVPVVRGPRDDVPWLALKPGGPGVGFDPDEEIEVVEDDGPLHVVVRLAGRGHVCVRVLRSSLDVACGRTPAPEPAAPPPHHHPRRRVP